MENRCTGIAIASEEEELHSVGIYESEVNEAGVNLEKESRIPIEEDTEEPESAFHKAEELFLELHPNEQNEIILKVFRARNSEISFLTKELAAKTTLYFDSLINGI